MKIRAVYILLYIYIYIFILMNTYYKNLNGMHTSKPNAYVAKEIITSFFHDYYNLY